MALAVACTNVMAQKPAKYKGRTGEQWFRKDREKRVQLGVVRHGLIHRFRVAGPRKILQHKALRFFILTFGYKQIIDAVDARLFQHIKQDFPFVRFKHNLFRHLTVSFPIRDNPSV